MSHNRLEFNEELCHQKSFLKCLIQFLLSLCPSLCFFRTHFITLQIQSEERFIRTEQGLLIRTLNKRDSGIYLCQAVEHGFMQTLLKVTLEVIDTERLEDLLHRDEEAAASAPALEFSSPRESPNQKLWYRDFLSLVNHPTLNTVDEFCEQVWKRERKHRRQKAHLVQQGQMHQQQQQQQQQQQKALVNPHTHMHAQGLAAKWKHLQERQKGRNRRTHELERAPRSVWPINLNF